MKQMLAVLLALAVTGCATVDGHSSDKVRDAETAIQAALKACHWTGGRERWRASYSYLTGRWEVWEGTLWYDEYGKPQGTTPSMAILRASDGVVEDCRGGILFVE